MIQIYESLLDKLTEQNAKLKQWIKMKKKVEREEFVNKTLEEICGQLHPTSGARPRSLRGRQGRIINGTKARYGGWPWQVSLTQWNKLKGKSLTMKQPVSNFHLDYDRDLHPQVRSYPAEFPVGSNGRALCSQVR